MNHGTRGCYTYYKCRCGPCTEANRLYGIDARQAYYRSEVPEGIHGRVSTYGNWGCRCVECSEVASIKNAEMHARRKANSTNPT